MEEQRITELNLRRSEPAVFLKTQPFLAEEIIDCSMIGKISLRDHTFKTVGHSEDTSTR